MMADILWLTLLVARLPFAAFLQLYVIIEIDAVSYKTLMEYIYQLFIKQVLGMSSQCIFC